MASQAGIAVIGAGIAGLLAARVLDRHGLRCTLIEPRGDLTGGGAGLVLWPGALRALEELGYPDAWCLGTALQESVLRDRRGRTLVRVPLALAPGRCPRAMARQTLMELLVDGLGQRAGARLQSACTALEVFDGRAVLTLASGEELEADAVLVAAGMNAALRQAVSPGSHPRSCHRRSFRGLTRFDHPQLARGTAIETLGPGCRVGLFPAGPGQVYWFVQLNDGADADDGAPFAARDYADWPAPIGAILAATDPGSIMATPITELLPAPRWQQGPLLLVGDAAHGMAPDLGRGACTAINNLLALDRAVVRHGSLAAALPRYLRRRRWRSWLVQHASRLAGTVRQLENRWLVALRNLLWRYLPPLLLLRLLVAPLWVRALRALRASRRDQ